MVYGFLFDRFHDAVYLVLIPTGVIAGAVGFLSRGVFGRMGKFYNLPPHDPYHEKITEAEEEST